MADSKKDSEVMSLESNEKDLQTSDSSSDGFEIFELSDIEDDPSTSDPVVASVQLPIANIVCDMNLPPENVKHAMDTVTNQSQDVNVSVTTTKGEVLSKDKTESPVQDHVYEVDKTDASISIMAEHPEPSMNALEMGKSTDVVPVSSDSNAGAATNNTDTKTQDSWVKQIQLKKLGPQFVLFYGRNKIKIPPKLATDETTNLSIVDGEVFVASEDEVYQVQITVDNKINFSALDSWNSEQDTSAVDTETYLESGEVDKDRCVQDGLEMSDDTSDVKATSNRDDSDPGDITCAEKDVDSLPPETNPTDEANVFKSHNPDISKLQLNSQRELEVKPFNTETEGFRKGKGDIDEMHGPPVSQQHSIDCESGNYVQLSTVARQPTATSMTSQKGGADEVETLIQGFTELSVHSSDKSDSEQLSVGKLTDVHGAAGGGDSQKNEMIGEGLSEKIVATETPQTGKHNTHSESGLASKRRKLLDTPQPLPKETNSSRRETSSDQDCGAICLNAGNVKDTASGNSAASHNVRVAIEYEHCLQGDTAYCKPVTAFNVSFDTYMRWQFVLHSPKLLSTANATINSRHRYSMTVDTCGRCEVNIGKVTTEPDTKQIADMVVRYILETSSTIVSNAFPDGGLNSQHIVEGIMKSDWGEKYLVYAEVGKDPDSRLVNIAYDEQYVTNVGNVINVGMKSARHECLQTQEKVETSTELRFESELIYKNIFSKERIDKELRLRLPSVSLDMSCINNKLVVTLKGRENEVNAAEDDIKTIKAKFTMNKFSLTVIKHFDVKSHSLDGLRQILNRVFNDQDVPVANCFWLVDDKKLYILASEQTTADKITNSFKKCLAHVELQSESEIKNLEELVMSLIDPKDYDMLLEKGISSNSVSIVGKKDVVRGLEDTFDSHCKAMSNSNVDHRLNIETVDMVEVSLNEGIARYFMKTSKSDTVEQRFAVALKFSNEGRTLEIRGLPDAVKNASNAIVSSAKTVTTAEVNCPGITEDYFKSTDGSCILHNIEHDHRVSTEVVSLSDGGACGGDGEVAAEGSTRRTWTFTDGHAVTVCRGDMKSCWKQLMVENQEMKRNEDCLSTATPSMVKASVGNVKVKVTGLKDNVSKARTELSRQLNGAQTTGNLKSSSPIQADAPITWSPTARVMDREGHYQGLIAADCGQHPSSDVPTQDPLRPVQHGSSTAGRINPSRTGFDSEPGAQSARRAVSTTIGGQHPSPVVRTRDPLRPVQHGSSTAGRINPSRTGFDSVPSAQSPQAITGTTVHGGTPRQNNHSNAAPKQPDSRTVQEQRNISATSSGGISGQKINSSTGSKSVTEDRTVHEHATVITTPATLSKDPSGVKSPPETDYKSGSSNAKVLSTGDTFRQGHSPDSPEPGSGDTAMKAAEPAYQPMEPTRQNINTGVPSAEPVTPPVRSTRPNTEAGVACINPAEADVVTPVLPPRSNQPASTASESTTATGMLSAGGQHPSPVVRTQDPLRPVQHGSTCSTAGRINPSRTGFNSEPSAQSAQAITGTTVHGGTPRQNNHSNTAPKQPDSRTVQEQRNISATSSGGISGQKINSSTGSKSVTEDRTVHEDAMVITTPATLSKDPSGVKSPPETDYKSGSSNSKVLSTGDTFRQGHSPDSPEPGSGDTAMKAAEPADPPMEPTRQNIKTGVPSAEPVTPPVRSTRPNTEAGVACINPAEADVVTPVLPPRSNRPAYTASESTTATGMLSAVLRSLMKRAPGGQHPSPVVPTQDPLRPVQHGSSTAGRINPSRTGFDSEPGAQSAQAITGTTVHGGTPRQDYHSDTAPKQPVSRTVQEQRNISAPSSGVEIAFGPRLEVKAAGQCETFDSAESGDSTGGMASEQTDITGESQDSETQGQGHSPDSPEPGSGDTAMKAAEPADPPMEPTLQNIKTGVPSAEPVTPPVRSTRPNTEAGVACINPAEADVVTPVLPPRSNRPASTASESTTATGMLSAGGQHPSPVVPTQDPSRPVQHGSSTAGRINPSRTGLDSEPGAQSAQAITGTTVHGGTPRQNYHSDTAPKQPVSRSFNRISKPWQTFQGGQHPSPVVPTQDPLRPVQHGSSTAGRINPSRTGFDSEPGAQSAQAITGTTVHGGTPRQDYHSDTAPKQPVSRTVQEQRNSSAPSSGGVNPMITGKLASMEVSESIVTKHESGDSTGGMATEQMDITGESQDSETQGIDDNLDKIMGLKLTPKVEIVEEKPTEDKSKENDEVTSHARRKPAIRSKPNIPTKPKMPNKPDHSQSTSKNISMSLDNTPSETDQSRETASESAQSEAGKQRPVPRSEPPIKSKPVISKKPEIPSKPIKPIKPVAK